MVILIMSKNFILGIGLEFEGAWNDLPNEFFNNHVYRNDGSISDLNENVCDICHKSKRRHIDDQISHTFEPMSRNDEHTYYNFVGEIASKPFLSKTGMLMNCTKWAIKYTPIDFNASCSAHLHFSIRNDLQYYLLNSKKFFKHFYNCLDYWLETRSIDKKSNFYKRVKGVNPQGIHGMNYCKKTFMPYDVKNKDEASSRYNGINFCKNKHNTIEIRIGTPFKDGYIMADYIKFCFDIINGFIARNYKPINIVRKFEI
jgi:hypothetical protein